MNTCSEEQSALQVELAPLYDVPPQKFSFEVDFEGKNQTLVAKGLGYSIIDGNAVYDLTLNNETVLKITLSLLPGKGGLITHVKPGVSSKSVCVAVNMFRKALTTQMAKQ